MVDAAKARVVPLVGIARRLAAHVAKLELSTSSHVYNPLQYAWSGQRTYLERYGRASAVAGRTHVPIIRVWGTLS